MGLATINIRFTADLRGFSTEMQNSMRRIGAFGQQMTNLGKSMSMYVTGPILAGGAAAIKFASDYEEALNKVDVAFGDSSAQVKSFAKETLETYGIAEGTALDMAAAYGDMGTAMGLTNDKAAKMSTSLVGLAGDIASFKNIGIDQANTALTSIYTGETESLKKLGIVMTEANLQSFALSKGIKVQIKDMDQAAKVNLRYAYVMNASKNAIGDFERTGGGASNQMRIFQESLKQVAQQFGSVILPAFTKAITYVNGLIKSFSGLSTETKTTIVGVAAVVASIGPLLTVFGSLLTFVPNVITKFNALKDAWLGLQAVLVANPFTAIAVALAAIATIVLVSTSRFGDLTNAQRDYANMNKVAVESIIDEKTALEKNLAIAKNKNLSDEIRKKAIEELNALSPKYLGNITLENLYTAQATDAVKKYTEAILQKARVQAAEEKLVEVQKRLLELQLGNLNAVKPSVWQNLGNAFMSAGNAGVFAARSGMTVAENLATETSEAQKLIAMLTLFIGKNRETVESTDLVADALSGLAAAGEGFKKGTVAFYEQQLDGLKKLQKEIPTTNQAWLVYEKQIDVIQKKIDVLENKNIKLKKPKVPAFDENDFIPPAFSLGNLKEQLSYFEAQREAYSTTSEEYKKLSTQINNTEIKINAIEGVDAFVKSASTIKATVIDLSETLKSALVQMAGDAAVFLGETIGNIISGTSSLGSVFSGMLSLVAGFMSSLGKSLIQVGIATIAFKKAFSNPYVAIGVGVALVALASVFKNIATKGPDMQAFANGGVVSGSSYYGDKILARVNSGEMIANDQQQKRIWGAMSGSSAGGGVIIPDVVLKGNDLWLSFKRTEERKNRLG